MKLEDLGIFSTLFWILLFVFNFTACLSSKIEPTNNIPIETQIESGKIVNEQENVAEKLNNKIISSVNDSWSYRIQTVGIVVTLIIITGSYPIGKLIWIILNRKGDKNG